MLHPLCSSPCPKTRAITKARFHTYHRAHVSNSGPRAKFGPKCNHIWPARSIKCALELARSFYHIFYFKLNVISHVPLISGFEIWLFQILCLSKIKAFFRMKRIKVTYQLQLIFQLLTRDFTSLLTFGPL